MSISKDRALRSAPAMAVSAAVLTALVTGGCATNTSQYPDTAWYAGGPQPAQADPEAVVAAAKASAVQNEADGRPAQVPPRLGVRSGPDDPTQPWSPNYGGPADTKKPGVAERSASAVPSEQDKSALQALQGMAARRVAWQAGN